MVVVDLFAGLGGWGEHLGIENDPEVVATRLAALLPTLQADVSMTAPRALLDEGQVEGILASPPCPPFSATGNGEGRKDLELMKAALEAISEGRDERRDFRRRSQDPRSILSVEPLRWVLELRPRWTAWEQVIGAMPIYEYAADLLAHAGYNVWVGILDAQDYGVAQTRKRAIVMAHRDRLVTPPPTQPRMVMRDVLDPGGEWRLRMGRSRGTVRSLDQPAPTIMFGKSPSGVGWYDGVRQVRSIHLEEALVLQGFPADYPVRGGKIAQYRQVGNAVPRTMGAAIVDYLS